MKRFLFFGFAIVTVLACTTTTPAATQQPTANVDTVTPPEATVTVGELPPDETDVWVYFTMANDENMTPVPVARTVAASDSEAELVSSTLKELLKGPTDAEKTAGLMSWFSSATADSLNQVVGGGGAFTVDVAGWNGLIPNASTSAGSQMLLSQLNSTMFQFNFVQTVTYTLGGDCAAFWGWLQGGCQPVTRAEWEAG